MENAELINIWKMQNAKIEKALAVNEILFKEVINNKARNSLRPLARLKSAGVIAFVLYILFLGYGVFYAISNYSSAWNYFIVSVSIIALINIRGLTDYIRHLSWVNNINYNGSVMEIQQQLARLKLSIIQHSKIMCLQFPFYTTFYLSDKWFPAEVGIGYLLLQTVITGSLAYLSYWLYSQHKPENFEKKWFRKMLEGSGLTSVINAMDFYKELETFKEDNSDV